MISVCMATYNGEAFVREQLQSILSQLSSDAEIIVADDGSTDGTLQVVESMGDSRIRVLPAEKRLGVIYNFERALQAANGDIIFLADQDDIWLPGKVAAIVDKLKECDMVMHDAFMLRQSDAQTGQWQRSGRLSDIRPYKSGVVGNWWKNTFTGCCMAFRKNVLEKALPFPKKLPMHDQWLGIVAERFFKVGFIADSLVEYRQHIANATRIGNSPAGFFQKVKWRLSLAWTILRR